MEILEMNIIYLDMDGVINNTATFAIEGRILLNAYDETLVSNLNYIIEKTNAKIVMTSTWRLSFKDANSINKHFKKIGILPVCIGKTKHLNMRSGWSGSFTDRGYEIKDNLSRFSRTTDNYVIIDDDHQYTLKQFGEHYFETDIEVGLTKEIAENIVDFLNKETNND